MKLSVEGYKSIASPLCIEVDGLTVLAGANSSGKSSFMQPFLLLKQTIENHYDSGAMMLDGENVKYTDSSQIISRVSGYKKKTFAVTISEKKSTTKVTYKHKRGQGIVVDSVCMSDKEDFKEGLTLTPGMKHEDIAPQVPDKHFKFINEIYAEEGKTPRWKVKRNKCFLSAELGADDKEFPPIKAGVDPTRQLENLVQHMIHVPGLRGNPERNYKISFSEEVFPGSFEKYIASLIAEWRRLKSKQSVLKELIEQLSRLGLATNITTARINDTRVELQVSRYNDNLVKDTVNIADVGFGVSQVVPVLVALLCAKKNQLVYIEQPELHLHPKAQFELAHVLIKAVSRGVRVLVETHSSILLRGIQLQVVKKQFPGEKVSLNWFTQDKDTGESKVVSERLDRYGAFGEWPEDFDDVSLNVEQMYLDAVEEALNGE